MPSSEQPGRVCVWGWDHPETARRYEAFCTRHARYRQANEELVARISFAPDAVVVDLGAGTGRTADEIRRAFDRGRILCVEPSNAMRAIGEARRPDVEWRGELPHLPVDVVVCGAAIWQDADPTALVARIASILRPGGVFAFNIPALYLGIPDREGGGADPTLSAIPLYLAQHAPPLQHDDQAGDASPPIRSELAWRSLLEDAGFAVDIHAFEHTLTQTELRDWLSLPVLTNRLLGALDLEARDRLLEEALDASDRASFKYEGWRVFVARKTRTSRTAHASSS